MIPKECSNFDSVTMISWHVGKQKRKTKLWSYREVIKEFESFSFFFNSHFCISGYMQSPTQS